MKKLTSALLFSILLLFIICFTNKVEASTVIQDSSGNYYFDYTSSFNFTDYYKNVDTTSADTLTSTLHTTISTGTKKLTYKEAWDGIKTVEEDPTNSNNVLCILTGKSMAKTAQDAGGGGDSVWNREHIWPKAHGFKDPDQEIAPYTDLNHLMPAEAYTNSTYHSDRDYGVVEKATNTDKYGNKYSNDTNTYEPRDAVKGDIARMVLYMVIRYNGDTLSEGVKLTLVDTTTSITDWKTSKEGSLGKISTLLEWMANDPVDDFERQRNDKVYTLQNNRNPFIDHPEWANIIFGAEYDTTSSKVHYVTPNATYTYVDRTGYETNSLITEPTATPIYNELGYKFVGWYTDSSLQTKWDFETDKITSDVFLYSKFEYVGLTSEQKWEQLQTKGQLDLGYLVAPLKNAQPVYETAIIKPTYTGGSISCSTNQTIDITDKTNANPQLFKVEAITHNKSSFYIKGDIRLYPGAGDGTEIKVTALGENATITACEYKFDQEATNKKTIDSNGKYASIQNVVNATSGSANQVKITEIKITYYTQAVAYDYLIDTENTYLSFGLEISKELFLDLESKGYDIKLLIDNKEVDYSIGTDDTDPIVILSAESILMKDTYKNNKYQSYTAKLAIVNDKNETYYTKEVTYSCVTIAKAYIDAYRDVEDEAVTPYIAVIKVLSTM